MPAKGTLQNQKYLTCIDACNDCAEACEYCATCDLQEQDVKAMTSCVQINRDCANICWTASQFMSRDSKYSKQICDVLRNVNDILIWIIVKNAHKYAEDALKNVVRYENSLMMLPYT